MSLYTDNSLRQSATMGIVLEALHELVDYELAVVLGFDGKDTLTVHTATGRLADSRIERFSLSLSARPDVRALLEAASPRLFAEDEAHLDTYEEILDLPEGHSCLAAPLVLSGEPIGLLTLDHRTCGVFSPEILRFISVISRLIAITLSQALHEVELHKRAERLAEERNRLLVLNDDVYRSYVGESPAWKEVVDLVGLVAATESPVLLLGETGTGKEETARLIHKLSSRKDGPFVAVNCSALPEALAESELFGHEKGAFTGALGLRKGRFELANNGTIFLDEVGDLPVEIQPKLLRALQERRFERVGGETSVGVDVRIIAATNAHLDKAVANGKFREDLYYRLSVFPIRLPPLRERGDDAVILAELFASRLRARRGWESLSFTPEALDVIAARSWPGNVRELRNAIERAAILSRGGEVRREHLESLSRISHAAGAREPECGYASRDAFGLSEGTLEAVTRTAILHALSQAGGKVYGADGAAALLGLKPTTLQSRMKKLGIKKP